ncbi:Sad1 / UNC-like C-terminal family protein [Acanthocheilonema viteae]|uniref:SUN domain-containing protein n=1 Tax=Acanthocheilonema viteae TaxID=6277 RepID=A0A498S9G6_ACAVI|nr:unnamed protein product [Acanthocheilonema viteae]
MFGSNLYGFFLLYLRFLYVVHFVQFLMSVPIDDTGWMLSYDISTFKKFLSNYRFPICSIYEEKEFDATSNDTISEVRSPKLNSEARQSTKSTAKSAFLEDTEASGDVTPPAQEIDSAVPFSTEQPPIVTFDEWTKEKLKKEEIRKAEQQQNHQHKSTVHSDAGETSKVDSNVVPEIVEGTTRFAPSNMISQEAAVRNYASKECGAKVLFSNDEAENKNAVLNEKEADDYMRNPCERAEHKWLIIELCETIQPTVLEVANFELFSSGPHNIRILGSERYPSNEWMALGDFTVENNREIQRFPIVARSYVKFLRLELLSHHGREHYCTLSLVRLLGISMVDEYEAEAEAAAVSDSSFAVPVEVQAVNSTAEEVDVDVVTPTSNANEVLFESKTKNESVNDLPFVDVVVNAVGSIGINNIKDVFGSTFLSKRTGVSTHNIIRSNATVVELCTKCSLDNVDSYVLFCRAFFGFRYNFVGTDNVNVAKNKQVDIHYSVKSQKKNRTRVLEFFLASILPTYMCDLESGNFENMQNSTSYNETELDKISTIPPIINSPTTSNLLNRKLGGGFMIPGGVMSHKESIFLKLNKRISSLELNMSLSSEYLSELSRRYVLQTNESRRQAELIIKQAEEAAINAIKPAINALRTQMDDLAISLRELTETVKALPQEVTPAHHSMILKHVGGRSGDADASLAHSQAYSHGYFSVWTSGELVCIVVSVNVLTLLILLLLHYAFTIVNRNAAGQVVDDRLQKLIQENCDIQSTAEVFPEHPKQQLMAEVSTVVCDVVDATTQAENVYNSSLAPPNDTYLLTERETEESRPNRPQSIGLVDRPSSQLSTHSELNLRQTRKRKNKKRKRNTRSENFDEPSSRFGILANLETE